MGPRKEKNKAQTEKCAELKEGWAEHLPLKYDDKTYGDRFGIQFFVDNFNSNVVDNSSDLADDLRQIFDAFSLMALNSLKTENDINDLKAKAPAPKNKNSKSNATMDFASLRHAVCSHFNKVVANHSKIQEFNTVFYAHFSGGKIPVQWKKSHRIWMLGFSKRILRRAIIRRWTNLRFISDIL